MNAIVTVTGLDATGIVAAVAGHLAEKNVNILDISQQTMGEYFAMILEIEVGEQSNMLQLQESLRALGEERGLVITLQSHAIFDAMHDL
ncbi:ACT domain-containing protein [Arcanobacterium wilhelmae]|uniref:ACT domain-containing protein n=1 Tax=Arcanobacterium wilhelmae TaxID=1803177 RepID=A0ABT9NB95_9ACTO|nr:ACT domain-containing protein [Arcanobacterium wilhelmae]MDP9800978.1 ACT domain-containing protein [Arcanobacterium wilhelmae]WFN90338.1 ACT domain-containing protein [Arcanobacterium wilhelmae]